MRILLITSFLLTISQVKALETDNFIVWDRDLLDSSVEINKLFRQEIDHVLKYVNEKNSSIGCRELTFKIANRFKTYPPLTIFIEDWLVANLSAEQIYPTNMSYISESIYKNAYGRLFKRIPLSPNIQVNNIYFGTDKLSHFTSTSRSYLKKYLKLIDKGYREEEAIKKAIDLGIFKENTILGLKFIGVYSYGDLEANYQGFRFYSKLCLENDSYLVKEGKGKWRVANYPDIRDYVSPYWDESFNLSYRSAKNWARTSRVIAKTYCSLFDSERVQKRRDYYQSILVPSFSIEYVKDLQAVHSLRTPNPQDEQSLEALCKSK